MACKQKYIDLIRKSANSENSVNLPLPNGDCAEEVILTMIRNAKCVVKICVKDLEESIYSTKKIKAALCSRSHLIFEGELVEGIPGYFAIFSEEAYIYQKSNKNGFTGTSNFHNKEIVSGMKIAWKVLTSSSKEKSQW